MEKSPSVTCTRSCIHTSIIDSIVIQQFQSIKSTVCSFPDIPLIGRFDLSVGIFTATRVAWLENKIYVLCDNVILTGDNVNRLRVFADHAPYEELSEGVVLKGVDDAFGMAASVSTRSIFFSDPFERCIWKLQIPQNKMKRIPVRHMPFWLSVGQDEELFVVMAYKDTKSIYIYRLADVSLVKFILPPKDISNVTCIAQSPNRDIVITHSTFANRYDYFISILSTDGEMIRTFNPGLHESLRESWWPHSFAIADTGDVFVVDPIYGRISMLNSQLTDFQIISCYGIQSPSLIIYIKEKQQLLISEGLTSDLFGMEEEVVKPIHVFHLSPCNLETKKQMKNLR